MIELSVEAASVAHGIHYGVVGVGLVGLFALIGPQLVGGLGVRVTSALPVTWVEREAVDHARSRYLPIAVVSSAAAAGVHAALGPVHFRELAVFGVFFAGAALAQAGWSVAMAVRPSRPLLVAAVVGNAAVLMLWLVTRTIGLPVLMPEPEAIGLWDLSCGAWELAVVVAAGRILRADRGSSLRLPAWNAWEPSARAWALGSAFVLPLLALVGVGV